MDKSNRTMKKKSFTGGCRILKFQCMSPSDLSSEETNGDPPVAPIFSSSTTSDVATTPTTPNRGRELVIASQLRNFAFNELKLATRNFRPDCLLGVGGFGSVYKGWINENGSSPVKQGIGIPVAVKTLNKYGLQGHREWLAEVNFLGNLHHQNLVTLVGYCMEDDKRLLVYEFMACGSLENHLFRRTVPLPWSIRMKIALGAAQGLAYLHEEAQKPIIYRDFKTSNILLDKDYNAKLSDFGLARDGPEGDKTHVSTRVVGTYGYAAPEYVMTGHLTMKSDVYGFGVVFLEILTGRRAMDNRRTRGEHNLVKWAKPYIDRHNLCQIIDPHLGGHFSRKGSLRSTEIVARCLRSNAKSRPQMSEVVKMLTPLTLMKEIASASNVQIKDASFNSNDNNVLAWVLAKDKHAAGTLPSPNGSYVSSFNYTLNYKDNRNIT
ncbi:hypothetical protein K7X08_019264 [Anisodus acutangulus]|uniref:non-specific serine/threonine protein kinase n=1 Tax=Anisodus acutangulus TaxID=402998 RepID=A0A9Q1MS39_9SOLA|nr:hypothetical protein K7X08_019264 [Anisodus acutangulus]